ncbi:hypothetical protein AAC387_Pa12g1931 [Persea americana]
MILGVFHSFAMLRCHRSALLECSAPHSCIPTVALLVPLTIRPSRSSHAVCICSFTRREDHIIPCLQFNEGRVCLHQRAHRSPNIILNASGVQNRMKVTVTSQPSTNTR